MRRYFTIFSLLFFFICLSAEWVSVPENSIPENSIPENSIPENSNPEKGVPEKSDLENSLFGYNNLRSDIIEIEFALDGFESEKINEAGVDYQKISYPGEGQTIEYGKPNLPTFSKLVAIPALANVGYELEIIDSEVISNILIYPQTAKLSSKQKHDFYLDEEFYGTSESYPEKTIFIGEPAIMRGLHLIPVKINPFKYNALTKELTIIKRLKVKLLIESDQSEIVLDAKYRSQTFEKMSSSQILNFSDLNLPANNRNSDYNAPGLLFIHANNSSLETALEPLVEWKREKGYDVTAVSTATTGTSLTSIKSYIQTAYNTWENPPAYICLVGDVGGSFNIPTGNVDNGVGDQYYVLLEGNDILADAIIGRISVDSVYELQTVIGKIFNYEKNPYMADTEWFEKALLIGDPQYSGPSTIITSKYIKETILTGNPNFLFEEEYSSNFVNAISSGINGGVGYYNYRGYINMSGWGNTNTSNLNNGFRTPIVMILTCATGNFNSNEAASEVFLRVGSPSVPKGAVAAIGTATSQTHTCFNNCVNGATYHSLFINGVETIGGALAEGKMVLYENYPDNPSNHTNQFSYWNNLMGDPTLKVWTAIPQDIYTTVDTEILLGQNYLHVNVRNEINYNLSEAVVTVYQEGNCFASLLTDASGNVDIPLDGVTLGDVRLTITKQNYIPYQESIDVVQGERILQIVDSVIDDDNSGSSSGNNDGFVNPNEIIELNLKLRNYGSSTANGITTSLSCPDRIIDIITANGAYSNLAAGQEGWATSDYLIEVADNAQGGDIASLKLQISDSMGNNWEDFYFLEIIGPKLNVESYVMQANGSRDLEPGQSGTMQITLHNDGSTTATGLQAVLSCTDNRINITDANGSYSNIAAGGSGVNSLNQFELTVGTQIYAGEQIQFRLAVTGQNYQTNKKFFVEFGDVQSYDPLGPDSYGYTCFDDSDSEYELVPYYNWVEIDPNLGGGGTNLNLSDPGNTGDSEIVSLPFNFRFFGQSYTNITVCSNGWIVLGETAQTTFMNRVIPGSLGPSPLIAPFWDDLKTGSGRVCTKSIPANHTFVVEWSNVLNEYDNSPETFQVILYDQDYYPSPTNDGDIKFQYKVVNNVDVGAYGGYSVHHGQYATVGIEDHTTTQGLQYTYNNLYPSAAKPLQNEMALLFTTNISAILEPPEAYVDVDEFSFTLNVDQSSSQSLNLQNNGQANLVYSFTKDYEDSPVILNNRDSGGPDTYGYMWKDSNENDGPEYNWVDISGSGTQVSFSTNDIATGLINIGFDFNYYGTDYDQFRISPNGWIGFGVDNTAWENTTIPNTSAPRPAIMPFWDDLHPADGSGGGGDVYYHSTSERLVVWFDDVYHWGTAYPGIYDFQVILYSNGHILIQYRDMQQTINSATIGFQNANGNDGLQIAYNTNYVENELALLIYSVTDWLNVNPGSGMIAQDGSEMITVTADSESLEEGTYSCILRLHTNDPTQSVIQIPVDLAVGVALTVPVNVQIQYNVSHISLSWNTVVGASSYKIYGSDLPDSGFNFITEVIGTNWSITPASGRKFYRITAMN